MGPLLNGTKRARIYIYIYIWVVRTTIMINYPGVLTSGSKALAISRKHEGALLARGSTFGTDVDQTHTKKTNNYMLHKTLSFLTPFPVFTRVACFRTHPHTSRTHPAHIPHPSVDSAPMEVQGLPIHRRKPHGRSKLRTHGHESGPATPKIPRKHPKEDQKLRYLSPQPCFTPTYAGRRPVVSTRSDPRYQARP